MHQIKETQLKKFYIEKSLALLLIFRPFICLQMTTSNYLSIIMIVFTIKLIKQKSTILTITLLMAIFITIMQITLNFKYLHILTSLFCLLNIFYRLKIYELPEIPDGVGYRKLTLSQKYKNLNIVIFYPVLDKSENQKKQIKWASEKTIQRLYQNRDKSKVKIPFFIYKFIFSYIHGYFLKFQKQGDYKYCDQAIIFSHGLGASLHSYITLLSNLAESKIIITVQHSEKIELNNQERINQKKFREKQIMQRATDINTVLQFFLHNSHQLIHLLGISYKIPQKIFYMGHSYGAATAIQAYLNLDKKQLINGVIALDPWLYPLKNQNLKLNLEKPFLIIQDEQFVTKNKDLSDRNKLFIQTNDANGIKIRLTEANHLHQCDLCFILGNTLNLIKNSQMNHKYLSASINLIDQFIKNPKKQSFLRFSQKQLQKISKQK